jgi:hypothetical protein
MPERYHYPIGSDVELQASIASEGGGGGGDFELVTKRVEIPHEAILTLYSDNYTLVEPTETLDYSGVPATLPVPVSCTVFGASGGGDPYNADASRRLLLFWSTGADKQIAHSVRWIAYDLGESQTVYMLEPFMQLPAPGETSLAATFQFYEPQTGNLDGNLQDNGLIVTLVTDEAPHDPTGGDESNKLVVFLTYYVAEL